MAAITGKKFFLGPQQTSPSYEHKDSRNSGETPRDIWSERGHNGKLKFKLPNGVTMPVLSNRNSGRTGGYCNLEIIQTKRDMNECDIPQIESPNRGFKLLKCPSRVQDASRDIKQGLLYRIGPYHWQTSREKATIPHDARDMFYLNNIHKEGSQGRFRESRLPHIPKERPWTVVLDHARHESTFPNQKQFLTPRKRRTMVMQFDNVNQKIKGERENTEFQVRRMKTEIGRFSTPEIEEDYTPPRPWVIMHGERPLKCEFTRPRYGNRRNTPRTYMICLPRTSTDKKYKSAENYMRYVETKKMNTDISEQNEKAKSPSGLSNVQQPKLKTPQVNGGKRIKSSKSAKTSSSRSKTEEATGDKSDAGSAKCSNGTRTPSTIKHVVPSGDANINCIGLKQELVVAPAYGYDSLVLQSVIDVNQPQQDVIPGTSDKT